MPKAKTPAARLIVDIHRASPDWARDLPAAARLARDAAAGALAQASAAGWPLPASLLRLGLALGDDRLLRRLNRRYRAKDKPTNVLAFPAANLPDAPAIGGAHFLGDIALALGVLEREASRAGKPLADHFRHLVIHGVLHLLGFDHESPSAARRMEGLEIRALAKFGIADPYTLGRAA